MSPLLMIPDDDCEKEQSEKEAKFVKRLLENDIQGGPKEWLLLNAATLLYAAGKGATSAARTSGA